MTLKPKPFLCLLTMAGLTLGLAGCSVADRIGNLNPLNRGEDLMPGDRRPALTRTGDALAGTVLSGKTASISAAVALSDWSQPGGNAANAPGNVSLSGGDGASLWRAQATAKVGKKGVRASAPPLTLGGRYYVYDAGGTVTALAGAGGRQWSVSLKPEDENSLTTGGGIAAIGNVIVAATGYGELVALDAASGEMKWYFQFTPHDTHDWDANQIPILFDAEFNGKDRKIVALANRNAFFYLLDRETGEFLHGNEYSKQTWAAGLDEEGRPIVLPGTDPTYEGNLVWPSLQGATNWFSPAYNPETEQFFVATRLMGAVYYKADVEYEEGQPFLGGGEQALSGDDAAGAIRALDVMTGRQQWEFMLHSPPWAGVMATAGGLVIGGSNEGNVFALDAETGKPLWDFQSGGAVRTNPMSFAVDGKQRIVTTAGSTMFVFGLE